MERGHVFGAESAFFGTFTIFSETNSSYAEFIGEKKEESVIAISLARENLSSRFFGRFWVSSTFWSQWSRFQIHLRSFVGDFTSGKRSGTPGPFSVLELFGGYVNPFLVIQKPRSAIFDLLSLMAEVLEPLEVIFTSKFSMQD